MDFAEFAVPAPRISGRDPVVDNSFAWASVQRSFERGCQQRHHNLVMSGKGNRLSGILRGSSQHVLSGTVMLDKVEICCCKFFKRVAQVAYHGHGLQENFRQHDCGSDIQVNASTIKLSSHTTKEAKIAIAGITEILAGCVGMGVNNIAT